MIFELRAEWIEDGIGKPLLAAFRQQWDRLGIVESVLSPEQQALLSR